MSTTAPMTTAPPPPPGSGATVTFERGIPGLTDHTEFSLSPLGDDLDGAFQLLTAVADPDVALIVTVPWTFFPDYAPELPEPDRAELELGRPEEAIVFCPVTLDAEASAIHLNLLGPFVVNASTRRGRQIVLADSDWPVRATISLDPS